MPRGTSALQRRSARAFLSFPISSLSIIIVTFRPAFEELERVRRGIDELRSSIGWRHSLVSSAQRNGKRFGQRSWGTTLMLTVSNFTVNQTPRLPRLVRYLFPCGAGRARCGPPDEAGDVLVNRQRGFLQVSAADGEVEHSAACQRNFTPEVFPRNRIRTIRVIVINKAAGLVIHPAARSIPGAGANALTYPFKSLERRIHPRIHHLDKTLRIYLVPEDRQIMRTIDGFARARIFKATC